MLQFKEGMNLEIFGMAVSNNLILMKDINVAPNDFESELYEGLLDQLMKENLKMAS